VTIYTRVHSIITPTDGMNLMDMDVRKSNALTCFLVRQSGAKESICSSQATRLPKQTRTLTLYTALGCQSPR
jgi:hypothetical protein